MNTTPDPSSSKLSRRGVLGLAAGAAGVATMPGLASGAAAQVTPQAVAPDILTDDIFPIGFFWPPPRSETNVARYNEIKEAGFNLVLGGNDVFNMPANDAMLDAAQAVGGLRVLPAENRINQEGVCSGWQGRIRATLEEYQAYPAFKGFRIHDEPSPVLYPRYRMITDELRAAAPETLSHLNLRPVYDIKRDEAYREYVARYVEQIDPSFVSFDHYPLLKDRTMRPAYFLNHRLIREAGLAAGVPTWVYIQSVDHGIMKRPNRAELAWQIYMSLAYGCKGIKYFTYWTPESRPDFEFGAALIDKNGNRTQVYQDAKALNNNHLQPVGQQVKHLVSESVVHANDDPLPFGAVEFSESAQLRAVEGGAVVLGQFKQPSTDARRWLLVANRAWNASTSVTVTIQPGVAEVAEFSVSTRTYNPVPLNNTPEGRTFTANFPAGGGRFYRLSP